MLHFQNFSISIDDSVCQAFNKGLVVGSKVVEPFYFMEGVEKLIREHDFTKDSTPGQGFLAVPEELFKYLSAGDGEHTDFAHDYIPAFHRGKVDAYLKRELAGEIKFAAVVVYTREAYEADPEVDARNCRLLSFWSATTHVIVAVLASSGPESPLTPYRLVSNIGGNNNNCLLKCTQEDLKDAHRTFLRSKQDNSRGLPVELPMEDFECVLHDAHKAHEWVDQAKMSKEYWDKYSLVAG